MTTEDTRAAAEHAARASYRRLVAVLIAPTGDIQQAQDSLSATMPTLSAARARPGNRQCRSGPTWYSNTMPPAMAMTTTAATMTIQTWKNASAMAAKPAAAASAIGQ